MNENIVSNKMTCERHDTLYPQQVSDDQANQENSEIAFSNGFSYQSFNIRNNKQDKNDTLLTDNSAINYNLPSRRENFSNNVQVNLSGRPLAPPRYLEFTEFSDRLRSYARWTKHSPDPTSLSNAGFFFTNQQDLVRCFQCGIGLKNFSYSDDPLEEHVRNSPSCPYLVQYLGKERLSSIQKRFQPETDLFHHRKTGELLTNENGKNVCRHPKYSSLQSRVSSFSGWPKHLLQKPQDLAEAGLYYTGNDDEVRCFTCDGGLRRWDPDDDPWTEHCRWFPSCQFARKMKGDALIALIQSSAKYRNGDNVNSSHEEQIDESTDISRKMQHMSLRDPQLQTALQEHKNACLEMGFQPDDVNAATEELMLQGKVKPTLDEILDAIYSRETRKKEEETQEIIQNETPSEENKRLKSFIICTMCNKNNTNTLFLPCTHHRFCMECAEILRRCPICDKVIRQKIRTFLV